MFLTLLYRVWLKVVFGIRVGQSWQMKGIPLIRAGGANSQIVIGDRFMSVCRIKDNPIGVPHRVIIRTVAPDAKIVIGDDVGMSGCVVCAAKSISIGHRVKIGSGALVVDSDLHSLVPDLHLRLQDELACRKGKCGPVSIGDDAFIGARAIILKGVQVGNGAIIGAGAVVTHDVPAGAMAVGNPARIIS